MGTPPPPDRAVPTDLQKLGAWLVAQLLAASGVWLEREWIRENAPFLGHECYSLTAQAEADRGHIYGSTRRASRNGLRTTKWLVKMIRDLGQAGIVERTPTSVRLLAPARLLDWAKTWGYVGEHPHLLDVPTAAAGAGEGPPAQVPPGVREAGPPDP